jgi:N-methylhydantoinase B/oxoprolinase/acetone carboxylase alpha subunit
MRNMRRLQDYSERMMRAALRDVPDGSYSFEDFLDNDGIHDVPIRIAVQVRIQGDEAEVDFRGSDRQAAGPVNANRAILAAATGYVLVRIPLPPARRCAFYIGTATAYSYPGGARIGRFGRSAGSDGCG